MPTNTPNLNLIKPLVTEKYTVSVANANNDILDTQVALLAPKANPTFTGTQTLPNIVTNGIKFPATQVPSADPNTLDDYEEGTWTPRFSGDHTYTTQDGTYIKIGKLVVLNFNLTINIKEVGFNGPVGIENLPFSIFGNATGSIGKVFGITMPSSYNNQMTIHQNYLIGNGGISYDYVLGSMLSNGCQLVASLTYSTF